jgi:hypothetical protein
LPAAQPSQSQPQIAANLAPTRIVETRYEIRPYRDAADPAVRHEAHAVYRSTRVPARVESLETAPRTAFAPVSYAPLPTNAELAAELSTQKQITEQLRAIQAKMTAVEEQARQQYGTLVSQTEESVKLTRQLEAERARVRELEAMLRYRAAPPAEKASPTVAATSAPEMKW